MLSTDSKYMAYIDILKEELVPAMGCTEPIAIAFAAAKARAVLGKMPDRVEITVSGNIIKNVKSVIVPNTGGLKGIEAAAAAGITVGDADKVLEVLASVSNEDKPRIKEFMASVPMVVRPSNEDVIFDIDITLHSGIYYSAACHTCFNGMRGSIFDAPCDSVYQFQGRSDSCRNSS